MTTFHCSDGLTVRHEVLGLDQAASLLCAHMPPADERYDDEDWEGGEGGNYLAVDLLDDNTNPAWVVTHLDGTVELAELGYVLDVVDPHDRQAALDAHIAVLKDLVGHYDALEQALEDSQAGDDISDGEEDSDYCQTMCVACVAAPEMHLDSLAEAIDTRARELAEALVHFPITLTITSAPHPRARRGAFGMRHCRRNLRATAPRPASAAKPETELLRDLDRVLAAYSNTVAFLAPWDWSGSTADLQRTVRALRRETATRRKA